MAMLTALVVDDASFVRDLIKRAVRQQFPVIETIDAADGKKAQSLMLRTTFDLILCDWEMPEMSGLELLQWMRQQPQYAKVPFIMITSRGDKSHVVEAIQQGVSEYLGKPFSPDGLGKKIRKVMGQTLAQAMAGAGKAPAVQAGALAQSASLLTRKTKPPTASATPAAVVAAADSPQCQPDAKARQVMNLATVRFADHTLQSVVKDINLNEVRVIARRDQQFPGILDQAVVDIEISETDVARLNGYVHQLQAVDKRQDTDFVSATIRFVDEDPKKMEDLSRFIARFRAAAPR
ncbi:MULTISPECIES: response regulator [unclassified Marinobacter]|jgi:CheY-like chemotaxis protein|uniref:response regulator n=1 Tax=unclassified Marinobacter TaxID=83889 RepID=UPI00200C8A68|nr:MULTISPECIES: response regulator [unclassified Marinobacter]MCL1478140.1 response regulator [Marinobacter sp.]MCL1480095.1 response regulator [Marinobacter sp.]MCL1484026.1 response regulator [Marinobacter sp.]MCL1486879.1 response regulator [Marinobacter sp.]UQG55703.1 response regulator [Marinobacter sp. M4C]